MTDFLYTYAIIPADTAARLASPPVQGIGGALVRPVCEGALAAIVGEVPAADFDEEPLNRNLADMDWLGPRAAVHQAVNAHVFDAAEAALPLSFGAVFRSEDSLRRLLRDRREEILERLTAVGGASEWVVTIRRNTARASAALDTGNEAMARLRQEIASSSPGRRFLLERKVAEVRRREVQHTDALVAEELSHALGSLVKQTFRETLVPQDGQTVVAVARASVLVERSREADLRSTFEDLARRWNARGYTVEHTGPWPPYRFGGLSATATAEASA